jgi:hypothetical protein
MTDKGLRFKPMLIREVAEIAGEPRETIRTRVRQPGLFDFMQVKGWKRFSDFETILVSVHARLKRATESDDLARVGMLLCGKKLVEEWIEDEDGNAYFQRSTFEAERFLIFWRDNSGSWTADIFDSIAATSEATNKRFEDSYSASPAFCIVNLRTILAQTLIAILEVQVAMGGEE